MLGLPAAAAFIGSCVLFVIGWMAADWLIVRRWGVPYSITEGMRSIIKHVPLLWTVLVFLLGCLIGGLMVHFAGTPLYQP